jgi:hypothetical protein
LDRKKIKAHDNIYFDIKTNFPKKKYLNKNDNKFLPAVLDEYKIKSKYLVSELSKKENKNTYIKSLKYVCNLFGENYIDYLKKIKWKNVLFCNIPNKKTHVLKNEYEKNCLVSLFNKWDDLEMVHGNIILSLNKLLSLRDYLEKIGFNLKFQVKNNSDYNNTYEIWSGFKKHLNRGYKLKYVFEDSFIKFIEEEIKKQIEEER